MSSPPFAVIFDMDGVLIDSVELNWQAHNEVLAQYGVHVNVDQLDGYVGRALGDQVAELNRNYGLDIDTAEFESAIVPIENRLQAHIKPKPGVLGLIKELTERGVPIAVGTSSPREIALKRLQTAGLVAHFDTIVTRNEVERHKPDPSVYLYAAKALGVEPRNCIVIEDAPAGLAAAHNAAMKCCMVKVPYVSAVDRREADLVVSTLAEVKPDELERLL
jgi:beta-phosphoglucomutase